MGDGEIQAGAHSRDAVLEIGAEEMPARFLPGTVQAMQEEGRRLLDEERVGYESVRAFATPRRLVLYVRGVAPVGPALVREIRGPASKAAFDAQGRPTRAAEGFARSQGVSVSDLVVRDEPRGRFVFAILKEGGREAKQALRAAFARLVPGMSFPRSMRWGAREFRFVRPIRWILALWGDEIVDFDIDGIASGRLTSGHRFITHGAVEVPSAEEYLDRLREAYCIVDQDERSQRILSGAAQAAREIGGRVVDDPDLLRELVYLAEYPVAFVGRFDEAHLELPREVIVTPMRGHQRYFPVEDGDGRLLPAFVAVRDGLATRLESVRRGNERVLAARLQDARFFYEEDKRSPLSAYVPRLSGVIFHEQLGTVADKARRTVALADAICREMGVDEDVRRAAVRAGELCKADLATNMVKEFPELQGVMGREYARLSGEGEQVAAAIFEHYLPRFAGDALPGSAAGAVLAVADKIDTLAGFYGLGLVPTGSEDPYALRRHLSGLVAVILDRGLDISMSWLIDEAISPFEAAGQLRQPARQVKDALLEAVRQRLRAVCMDRGVRYDLVDAALGAGFDDLPDALRRAEALERASGTDEFALAVTGYTRASRIAGGADHGPVDPAVLQEPAERRLFDAYCRVRDAVAHAVGGRDYVAALGHISTLADPINEFFEDVLVMTDDVALRRNRLALLAAVAALARGIADLSRVVQAPAS